MIGVLFLLLLFLLLLLGGRHLILKKQIRKLTAQIRSITEGSCEKMLELSLIDRDLERLAGVLNEYYAGQRHAVARALRHEEQLKETVAGISHDLRTPLTVLVGHLQLLRESGLSAGQRQRVEISLRRAERMKELIGSFYELSVLEADQSEPEKEKVSLSNLLIDFLAENAPLLENRNILPEVCLPQASVVVMSDRGMLERILQNLLTNAVRYTAGYVKITLGLEEDKRAFLEIENTVRDTFRPDTERLFDLFYTGDPSRHGSGTGLGLPVVKMLAEKLGGQVSAGLQENVLTVKVRF